MQNRFEISQTTWFSIPEERQRAHLEKFSESFQPIAEENSNYDTPEVTAIPDETHSICVLTSTLSSSSVQKLSIGPDDTGIQQVPQEIIGGIWEKAESLLNDPTAITFAPGTNSKARMVMSKSNSLPQYVTTHEPFDGQFICSCHNGNFLSNMFPFSCYSRGQSLAGRIPGLAFFQV